MFYKPKAEETGRMWDTWLFYHRDAYPLYYLASRSDCPWDNISMAVSGDRVRWSGSARC
ncbi:MAG: hypothetical protein IT210_00365 [Armatimonadetes bacterium]|nr:hypothetical protein [Armatimonadota bacterium]